ncbi:hypothetical protein C8R43DRAFT_1114498 [Mycena crocata]|nr:hypothetical protein C8R43DRAFT_1114498 [Mycena crocata]
MSIASASTLPGYVLRYRSHAMDGVYSIVAGLLLRVVVDAATFHNVKLSGTLVGLWEGVVVLHYVKKAPTSTDPYLAYGVRLFVDFLVTESIFKLVVVLLWSTMGMVLADVAPEVWVDTGLKRQWSRFRRDIYRSARMFNKRRTTTVRFVSAPTIAPTMASSSRSTVSSVGSTTIATTVFPAPTEATEVPDSPTTSMAPNQPPIIIRRRSFVPVPGRFPGAEWSETDTDVGTARDREPDEDEDAQTPIYPAQPSHVTIARIIPSEASEDTYSFTTSSRSSSPAYSLEYSDDPSASNPVDIPSDVEEEVFSRRRATVHSDRETTPKQTLVVLPPTPAESLHDWDSTPGHEDVPPSPWMPLIPDTEPLDEWETVNADEEVPLRIVAPDNASQHDAGSDRTSIAAPSTIAPDPPAPIDDPDDPPAPVAPPALPAVEEKPPQIPPPENVISPEDVAPPQDVTTPADAPPEDAAPSTDAPLEDVVPPEAVTEDVVPPEAVTETMPLPEPDVTHDSPLSYHPDLASPLPVHDSALPAEQPARTPPPSFEDLYGGPNPAPATGGTEPARSLLLSREPTPPPAPSVKDALALRKEALAITARIASLARQRKTSLSDGSAAATTAAVLTKLEMERAEKELAEVSAKAEGAFVGAYNPPTASLYEFNTTGLTPEEAVRQTEVRLGQLLLAPVPPAGTRPEDLAHDSPNRSALKVVMEQSIKGRLVKQQVLAALTSNGLNSTEDRTRPNILFVTLPVTAAEPDSEPAAEGEQSAKKDDDNASAKEY